MIPARKQFKAKQTKHAPAAAGSQQKNAASMCCKADNLAVTLVSVDELTSYKGNARTHSRRQVRQIADSIAQFGFTNPVLIDDDGMIIAGHGRVKAAKLLGLAAIPTLRLSHLSDSEKRAYMIADNKLAERAGWDRKILATELQALIDLDFEVGVTGFDVDEIEIILEGTDKPTPEGANAEREVPNPLPAVSRPGDRWLLGAHQLICSDRLDAADDADVAIRGWQKHTGKSVMLAGTPLTFEEIQQSRTLPPAAPSAIAIDDTPAAAEMR